MAGAIKERARTRDSVLLQEISKISRRLEIAIAVGYAEAPSDSPGTIYNAFAVVDEQGLLIHHYRKTHLFGDYEREIFTAGEEEDFYVSAFSNGIRLVFFLSVVV